MSLANPWKMPLEDVIREANEMNAGSVQMVWRDEQDNPLHAVIIITDPEMTVAALEVLKPILDVE